MTIRIVKQKEEILLRNDFTQQRWFVGFRTSWQASVKVSVKVCLGPFNRRFHNLGFEKQGEGSARRKERKCQIYHCQKQSASPASPAVKF